jgi:molybdate transport system substrate-binding protein
MENVVRPLSTLALKGAVQNLAGPFEAAGRARIDADFAPTLGLLDRLQSRESADVVILTGEGLDGLAARGSVVGETCVDLARAVQSDALLKYLASAEVAPVLRAAGLEP